MKYVIGNLKMNLISDVELERYFSAFKKEIADKKFSNAEIVLCPPAVYIEKFVNILGSKKIRIGAQNIFWEKQGPFTGEISAPMVKSLKAEYAIIGHSERRKYFGETDETANLKIKSALKSGLTPVYCVGESKLERERGLTKEIIAGQLAGGLKDISCTRLKELIIAYEPVWSVGTDAIPTANEVMEVKILIKKIISFDFRSKTIPPIIYGGSVNSTTAKKVCVEPVMDGVLVGRESLMAHEFVKIAAIINNC